MIICRTPFRISLFGGGTDFPKFYSQHKGQVLSTTIDKYSYINLRLLPPFFDYKYKIVYYLKETVNSINEIKHPAVRACLEYLNEFRGINLQHDADLPARTGIGSSSTFTVGLLNALYALNGKIVTKRQLANDAINVEQKILEEYVGSQDQFAASFGGFNHIEFQPDGQIEVRPMTLSAEKLNMLQSHLLMFFTGFARDSTEIQKHHVDAIDKNESELKIISSMVDTSIGILNSKNSSIKDFGTLMHEAWGLKKKLTNKVTLPYIEEVYNVGMANGALGGKILGAGGGGFILFFAPPETHSTIKEKLKKLPYIPFRFESNGSQIVYYKPFVNF